MSLIKEYRDMVPVKAIQWQGGDYPGECYQELMGWLADTTGSGPIGKIHDDGSAEITVADFTLYLDVGDWIVQDLHGNFHVTVAPVFRARYAAVSLEDK